MMMTIGEPIEVNVDLPQLSQVTNSQGDCRCVSGELQRYR